RRGDLSWVVYLNAFVLLLVAATSLFGQLPGPAGQIAARFAGGTALQAGLLLPLFFMSFALLESIKSSIGIWWEKAQGSLEVLLYTPLDDPSLVWLEVLPGVAVSGVWVTFWMAAGMALLSFFGEPAPWELLPVFAFVAGVLLAAVPAGIAETVSATAHWTSWSEVRASVERQPVDPQLVSSHPDPQPARSDSGITVAAAGLAGVVATLALMLLMVIVS